MEQQQVDILIVGSGIAGMFAALKLKPEYSVLLVSKGTMATCNTGQAQGGIAAAIAADDSPQMHLEDTLMAGAGLCETEMVGLLVTEGPSRVRELLELGVPFDREQGNDALALTREGAHSRRRILHAGGDATGRFIWESLAKRTLQSGVKVLEHTFVTRLLLTDTHCWGAVVLDASGKETIIQARCVILACGGSGRLYPNTTNNPGATGDGIALAYRAGAKVTDVEFFQFHPTTVHHPQLRGFLISEAVRGEGAVLRNSKGERFMLPLHPLGELAPRDVVARGIYAEISRQEDPFVFLDATSLGRSFLEERFPTIFEHCLQVGLDISRDWLPVIPAAHYAMGGVITDCWGRTNVEGLFACGEVAFTGVHGANRLASNSLLEAVVFAGRIADWLNDSLPAWPLSIKDDIKDCCSEGIIPLSLLAEFRDRMQQQLGMIRSRSGLEDFLGWTEEIVLPEKAAVDRQLMELQNMVLLSKLMAVAALKREESRGAHYRSDFPLVNPDWQKHLVQQNGHELEVMAAK